MPRFCGFGVGALLLAISGLIQTTLIIVSGSGPHVLLENHFISIDVSNLNIPARLYNSTFLLDIGSYAGLDLVGSGSMPETLGLGMTYTVSLLTACARDSNGDSSCARPKVGYWFNPGKDLRLDGSSFMGLQDDEYRNQIESYKKVAYYLAVAYLVSAVSLFLCIILNLISICFPSATIGSLVFAFIATLFLFTGSVVSVVKFGQLRDQFNTTLGSTGLHTTLGQRVYILSFIAFAVSLGATIVLAVRHKKQQSMQRHRILDRGIPPKGFAAAESQPATGVFKPGVIRHLTTWNRHRYSQVKKHPVVVQNRSISPEDDHRGLVAAVEDDFPHEYPGDIAMGAMSTHASTRDRTLNDASTAYDPYHAI
ncbi:uncharacterized protein JN550_000991 [Neoarthrinium moseri]|uniref:uncharacterized protein n=1 Tax=Neoarthrinium moseri TaxID=1658444 RepID=UPI001FDDC576|nr:uncharacterized protein JN550_000991 [Neoarthrinium moseri]KAI1876919.1 hypothetical protein JN550_000991 [Neoarthrinium moseri]